MSTYGWRSNTVRLPTLGVVQSDRHAKMAHKYHFMAPLSNLDVL